MEGILETARRTTRAALVFCCVSVWASFGLVGCSAETSDADGSPETVNAGDVTNPAKLPTEPRPTEPVDPQSEPAMAFAFQLEFVRNTDVDGVKSCMLPTSRGVVKAEDLEYASVRLGSTPATDMAYRWETQAATATAFQKSGAKLVEMQLVDGKWFAVDQWWPSKP